MSLRIPSIFIQSIKTYFFIFFLTGIVLLVLINWSFYSSAQNIKQSVALQIQLEAEKEMRGILSATVKKLQKNLKAFSEWDEVHQQINNPSYYFFWHDERLVDSAYFNKHYQQLEIYSLNKTLLTSPTNQLDKALPSTLSDTTTQLVFTPGAEARLNMFEPIYARDSNEVIGYAALSVNLLPYILNENKFNHINKTSLSFLGTDRVPLDNLDNIMEVTHFKPISNPVTDYLWQLIEEFILQLIALLLLTVIIISIVFNKLFSQPLAILSKHLHRLKSNPKEAQFPPQETFYLKEFQELKTSLHEYHHDLQATQQALDSQNQAVWEQSRRDVLTNIYNRNAFDEAWNDVLVNFHHHRVTTAFMLFDCDFFKALNDTYGHDIGDEVIRIAAETIQKSLPVECPAYRIGGDEFAVILQNKSSEQTFAIADKCINALKKYNFGTLGVREKVSFSVGISSANPNHPKTPSNDISSLPRQADIAMYKAKQSHQHKIQYYHQQLEAEANAIVSNEAVNTIVNAIHTGENINMHFQPILSLQTGRVYFESLIRINKESGLIYPSDIFAIVERRRLEVEMDQQIIQSILNFVKTGKLPKETGVAINISGKTLLQPNFISLFKDFIPYLNDYKVIIEVTENILIDHMEYAQDVLNKLRQQGFLIALDDFGSGYSSIRYLAHMPVDIIKFDMSMTHALKSDEKTRNIILSTAEMVLRSGYQLVMEGIEDQEMYQGAKLAGATHIQGYLLGKPNAQPLVPKWSDTVWSKQ